MDLNNIVHCKCIPRTRCTSLNYDEIHPYIYTHRNIMIYICVANVYLEE